MVVVDPVSPPQRGPAALQRGVTGRAEGYHRRLPVAAMLPDTAQKWRADQAELPPGSASSSQEHLDAHPITVAEVPARA